MTVLTVALAAVAALAVALVLLRVWRSQQRRAADFADLARRRGWAVDGPRSVPGRGWVVNIRPDPGAGAGWQLESWRQESESSGTQTRWAEFTLPRAGRGNLVVGPPIPPEAAMLGMSLLGLLDGPLGSKFRRALLGPDADSLAGLEPQARSGPITVLADSAAPRLDLDAYARSLAAWTARHPQPDRHPILVLTPDRARLRLREAPQTAAELEAFADWCLTALEALGEV
jgi:hypothetical protein